MRRVTLHKSLWKPVLFMGCERLPIIIMGFTVLIFIVEGGWVLKIISVSIFAILSGILAFFDARDPFYFSILMSYLFKYQEHYINVPLAPGKLTKTLLKESDIT